MKTTEIIQVWAARDENNKLWLYEKKPCKNIKGVYVSGGVWEIIGGDFMRLPDNFFPEIKWSDEEPTEMTITITKNE